MNNYYNFSHKLEHKIAAALVLEKLCQLAEVCCLKAITDCELEHEQMMHQLGSNKIDAQAKVAIIMKAAQRADAPEICNLADKLLFWLPGRPDAPLEIIRQRTRGIAGLLLIQAAQERADRRLSQELQILKTRIQ